MRFILYFASFFTVFFLNAKEIDLDSLIEDNPFLVVRFVKHGCTACLSMNRSIDSAKKKFPSITFVDVNYENNRHVASRFKIKSVPTIILFQNGKEVLYHKGSMTYEQLKTLIKTSFDEL